jgi:hypothetical protein
MENTPRLYDTLVTVLSQHRNWLDRRHLQTLAWMMVGLILSHTISLPEGVPFVHSRAQFAQSTVRRFRRWLDNKRIHVQALWSFDSASLVGMGRERALPGFGHLDVVGQVLHHPPFGGLSGPSRAPGVDRPGASQQCRSL